MPFLTRLKTYFRFFPRRLASGESRALFAHGCMEGDAATWFEPIIRDFLDNEEHHQDQETANIFAEWDNFETALKDTFGMVNEERQAAAQIHQVKQIKSAAAYAIAFRRIAAKLEWDDDVLMEIFYQGLKAEVKDELYKADRPDTLTEYITMTVKIDEREYERRKERAEDRRKGRQTSHDPYYPNKFNPKGRQSQGKRYSTSYGTRAGPMELGAAQINKKEVECYNCHKKGHFARECRSPKKESTFEKVPEGKKWPKRANEEQRAVRTTRQLNVVRKVHGAYDTTGLPTKGLNPEATTWEPTDKNKTLTEIFYQGLKAEVKDELDKVKKPDTLKECIALAVEADEQEPTTQATTKCTKVHGHLARNCSRNNHDAMSWTACYDDDCRTHKEEKENSGWYPRLRRRTSSTDKEGCWADHTINCETKDCPKHWKEANEIYQRMIKMNNRGFRFADRTGGNVEDRI